MRHRLSQLRADRTRIGGHAVSQVVSRVDLALREVWLTWDTMMTTAEQMTACGAHYTALLETIDHQGATKLHAGEREQLLEAADALLFGEPEKQQLLRSAEDLIESLEASERWSAEGCDQLREHLYGCDTAAG
jgi:hypothetical protein